MKVMILAVLGLFAAGTPVSTPVPVPVPVRVTEPVRVEHAGISEELRHVEGWLDSLDAVSPAERAKLVKRTVYFLEEHLVDNIAWEERRLYPAIDARIFAGHAATEPLRFEHELILRNLGEIDREARAPAADVATFRRHTNELIGLVKAHFEVEDEVLLPILDEAMTKLEYEREIGSGSHGGPT